ncbi:MAG: GGDEF domain-containing protein [Aliarcobacter sp.]|nr:GGDEF domain-containing protein [Aliarcobacter sp.]
MFTKQFNLSTQLLKSILVIYLILTFFVTVIHLYVDYQYTKNNIQNELEQTAKTFQPALQTALWELNDEQLKSLADGMLNIPLIYGVQIKNSSNEIMIEKFQKNINKLKDLEYSYHFVIHHQLNGNSIYLANATIYSHEDVIFERLKVGFLMILLSAIIKTAVLVFLFMITFSKYLEKPLQDLTNTIVKLRVEDINKRKISVDMKYDNELKILQDEFNKLLNKISNEEIKRVELLREINQKLESEVEKRTEELEYIAITDGLTQLYNRSKMDKELQKLDVIFKRYGRIFSVIMIDIDFFKSVNDTYGHQVGDSVLKEFATILKQNIRNSDFIGRWGGEEFLIVCIETSEENAIKLASSLREKIETTLFTKVGHKTMSVGVAQMEEGIVLDDLINNADKALYFAKDNGRNRVVAFSQI